MAIINNFSEIEKLIPEAHSDYYRSPFSYVDDEVIACNPLYAILISKSSGNIVQIFRVSFLVIKVQSGYRLLLSNLSKDIKSTVDFVKVDAVNMEKNDWPFKNEGNGLFIDTHNNYKVYFCTDYDDMFEIKKKLNARLNTPSTSNIETKKTVIASPVYV